MPGELPLPVDPDAEEALGVDLELHPGAAVRDDLPDEGVRALAGEEDARRAVELRDDDALRPVDDEGAVVRHEGDVAEVDLLLLDVPDRPLLRGALPRRGVLLVEDLEAERHLERHGVGEPALLALGDRERQAELDRRPADLVDRDLVRVRVAAGLALDPVRARVLHPHRRAAVLAGEPQVLDPLEPAAPRRPLADAVGDVLERAGLAEVGEGEHAAEDGLQTDVRPLRGEQVHLEEVLVGPPLDVDQVRQGQEGLDLAEIVSGVLPRGEHAVSHSSGLPSAERRVTRKEGNTARRDGAISEGPGEPAPRRIDVRHRTVSRWGHAGLLDLDLGADLLELLLDRGRLVLRDGLLEDPEVLDEVLGLLEAEGRVDLADRLDDVDLVASRPP